MLPEHRAPYASTSGGPTKTSEIDSKSMYALKAKAVGSQLSCKHFSEVTSERSAVGGVVLVSRGVGLGFRLEIKRTAGFFPRFRPRAQGHHHVIIRI